MFLTSSFMVYRKIKNCDKFGMTKSDKVDNIILKVPISKYVPNILRMENVPFGVLSQHFFWTKSDVKTQQSPHKRCQTLRLIWIFLCLTPLSTIFQLYHGDQFSWWRKPERTTDHGQATGKLDHLRLRVECTIFCNLQSRALTHAVLVIGLHEWLDPKT